MFKYIKLSRLALLCVFLFTIFATSFLSPTGVMAEKASSDYSDVTKPTDDKPVGIWVDRLYIIVFNIGKDKKGQRFKNNHEKGLGTGKNEYIHSGDILVVDFPKRDSKPTSGTLNGTSIKLVKPENAVIDAYYDEEKDTFELFRYLSDAGRCAVWGGEPKYSDGPVTFTKNEDGRYSKDGATKGYPPIVEDIKSISDQKYSFAQKDTCDQSVGNDMTNHYTDPNKNTATLYAAKGSSQKNSLDRAEERAKELNGEAAKESKLEEYFSDPNSTQSKVLEGCAKEFVTGDRSKETLLGIIARGEPGGFMDCLKGYLANDPEFEEILATTDESDYSTQTDEEQDECNMGIPFIGDLICKMVKVVFEGISSMFGAVIDFFGNTGETFDRLDSKPTFKTAWESLRNISNIIFVVAFLVVIFQYLTNINVVDAYFIKKFLPRVLIAAILVQASWWIVMEMNAFTSDLGSSIRTIVLQGGGTEISLATGDGAIAQIAGGFLAGFAFLSPVGMVIVALIVGVILLLILLVCILILAMREALLVLLAILAPLAFASFAVPQLEGTLKKWLNMYIKLLMMYPIMQLLLAVGVIIGNVLGQMGGLYQLFGFIAYFLPFIVLPFTYKMGGNVMGKLVGSAKQLGKNAKGTFDRTPMGRDREAYKKLRSEDTARRRHGKSIERAIDAHEVLAGERRGNRSLARWRSRGLGKGKEREDTIASFRAAHDKEAVRRQVAQKDALNAQRTGHSLEIEKSVLDDQTALMDQPMAPETASALGYSSHLDATGAQRKVSASDARTLALDRLASRATNLTDTDQQEYFAIMQELGRQKATAHIGKIQTSLAAQGAAGAQRWNAGVADNEVFSATTALDKGFGQSVNGYGTIGEAQEGVAATRLSTFMAKNLQSRAGDQADAWKGAVHTAIQTGDTEKYDQIFKDLEDIEGNDNINGNLNISTDDLKKYADQVRMNRGAEKGKSQYDPTRPRNKDDPNW